MPKKRNLEPHLFSEERLSEIGKNALNVLFGERYKHNHPVGSIDICNALDISYPEAVSQGFIKPSRIVYDLSSMEQTESQPVLRHFWVTDMQRALNLFRSPWQLTTHSQRNSLSAPSKVPCKLQMLHYTGTTNAKLLGKYDLLANDLWHDAEGKQAQFVWPRQDLPALVKSTFGQLQTKMYFSVLPADVFFETAFYVASKDRPQASKADALHYFPQLSAAVEYFRTCQDERLSDPSAPVMELGAVFTDLASHEKHEPWQFVKPIMKEHDEIPGVVSFDCTPVPCPFRKQIDISPIVSELAKLDRENLFGDLDLGDCYISMVLPGSPYGPELERTNTTGHPLIAVDHNPNLDSIHPNYQVFEPKFFASYCEQYSSRNLLKNSVAIIKPWLQVQMERWEEKLASPSFDDLLSDAQQRSGDQTKSTNGIVYERYSL